MEEPLLHALLADDSKRVSGKLARFLYRNVPSESVQILALSRIAFDKEAPWAQGFFWSELAQRKQTAFGDWLVIALTRSWCGSREKAAAFLALYRDPTAHPLTKGSAIAALNSCANEIRMTLKEDAQTFFNHDELWKEIRGACLCALQDPGNAYARGEACSLSWHFSGLESYVRRLLDDSNLAVPGTSLTVSQLARESLEDHALPRP